MIKNDIELMETLLSDINESYAKVRRELEHLQYCIYNAQIKIDDTKHLLERLKNERNTDKKENASD